jgi:hypothetical protein
MSLAQIAVKILMCQSRWTAYKIVTNSWNSPEKIPLKIISSQRIFFLKNKLIILHLLQYYGNYLVIVLLVRCNNLIYNPLTLAKSENGLIYVFCVFFVSSVVENLPPILIQIFIIQRVYRQFTGGIVSSESDIRVVLAFDKKEWKVNEV